MQKVRVHCFGVSVDGYGAGPSQSLDHPLGVGGLGLMEWFFPTPTFQRLHNPNHAPDDLSTPKNAATDVDETFAAQSFENIGAWIMGRNMFGPIRGPWLDDAWKGWWGDNPVYHCEVFVLTHHARAPLTMQGGTTFHFVTDGIEAALQRAKAAAKGQDVRVGGGVATIRAFLQAGLVDQLHLAQSPVLLGSGESLFTGLNLPALGYQRVERVSSPKTTHILVTRS